MKDPYNLALANHTKTLLPKGSNNDQSKLVDFSDTHLNGDWISGFVSGDGNFTVMNMDNNRPVPRFLFRVTQHKRDK